MTLHLTPFSRRIQECPQDGACFTVTTFNVQNLFSPGADETITRVPPARPEETAVRVQKLTQAIVTELSLPHILALQEVGDEAVLRQLAEQVNRAAGTAYTAAAPLTSDRRGTRLAFMWDANRVQAKAVWQLTGEEVAAAFGKQSDSPGREPLIGEFVVQDQLICLVNNHLKSNYVAAEDDALADAIHQKSHAQRLAQARVNRRFVDDWLSRHEDGWLLVLGDFNDGDTQPGSPQALLLDGQPPLTNLLLDKGDGVRPYTFQRLGQYQLLDHILASPAAAVACTAVNALHFNADFDPALQTNPETVLRASDHDPVEACFCLA
ncbi:MAG: hypothetical protein Kow0080_05310 [Candidatus Promineifilaceae bacterium]